jgi:hypothetical protein
LKDARERLENTNMQIKSAKAEMGKPFPQEEEMKQVEMRLSELNSMLNMDEKSHDDVDMDIDDAEAIRAPERDAGRER